MDAYQTEQEQIEQLKSWIKSYGPPFLIGGVLALLIGFGWQYWQKKTTQKSEAAARQYTTMVNSIGEANTAEVQRSAQNLIDNFANTPYAAWAAMALAKIAITHQNDDEAKQQLQWVLNHSHNPALQQTARLRLARLLVQQNQGYAALTLLEKIDHTTYQALIFEIKGDAYLSLGKTKEAQDAYQAAFNHYAKQNLASPEILTLKLHNIYLIDTLEKKGQ